MITFTSIGLVCRKCGAQTFTTKTTLISTRRFTAYTRGSFNKQVRKRHLP